MQMTNKIRYIIIHFIRNIFSLFLIIFVLITSYIFFTIVKAPKISTQDIYKNIAVSSHMYDNEGNEIDTLFYDENRTLLTYDEISATLVNAVVSIEDKTFWTHHGFNFKRIIGAVISAILNDGDIQGTSTISQQLARNIYLADIKSERSINRKIVEMYYAYQIEQSLTKEKIIEAYLNTVYFGYGCYGIDSASKTYFSKEVKDLDLAECAALASLPQAPDAYAFIKYEGEKKDKIRGTNLYVNDISKERRDMTLDLMEEQGYISKKQRDKAKVDLKDILNPSIDTRDSDYTYFIDYAVTTVIKDLMENEKISEEDAYKLLYTGGLNIYTTIDPTAQKAILDEFDNQYNFPATISEEKAQAAMVITEVKTGKIIAMVGGRGDPDGSMLYNRATSPRQPGSSIKPLAVYGAALQKSYDYAQEGKPFPFKYYNHDKQKTSGWGKYITAGSLVIDEKMTVDGNTWPLNFSRTYTGRQTFRTALQQSINTCAVKILYQVGFKDSINTVKKFGISTIVDDTSKPYNDLNAAALGLGAMTYGVSPLDMSLAYATFPNNGVRNSAVCYTKVTDKNGKTILKGKSKQTKVLDEGVAWIMTDLLKSVVSHGIAGNAYLYNVQSGGKTGTTNNNNDFWFCGFSPKYSAALWIGTDRNHGMYGTSSYASSLWGKIMRNIPEANKGQYHSIPPNVINYKGEYYTTGTTP